MTNKPDLKAIQEFVREKCGVEDPSFNDIMRISRGLGGSRDITLAIDADGNIWDLEKISSSQEWYKSAKVGWWNYNDDRVSVQQSEDQIAIASLLGYKEGGGE